VAADSPENEQAYGADPYEPPDEVALKTLDMSLIYRKTGFVPGDCFEVTVRNWDKCWFELTRVPKDTWDEKDIAEWVKCAEESFLKTFEYPGPGDSTEEQITWAYWFGGERMRRTPALALDNFLLEVTDKVEFAQYGMESRFWYAGREIPDVDEVFTYSNQAMITPIENLMQQKGMPITEFAMRAYVLDSLFRRENGIENILKRLVPPSIKMDRFSSMILAYYIKEVYTMLSKSYNMFADKNLGPLRQRVVELHTAVIDLVATLKKSKLDRKWLPPQCFIVLGQIRYHSAMLLEELDAERAVEDTELEMMDNSLDSMVDTYEEVKEQIESSLDNYRKNHLTLVKTGEDEQTASWRVIQMGIGGASVWRRIIVPTQIPLSMLHRVIQAIFGWKEAFPHKFIAPFITDKLLDRDGGIKPSIQMEKIFEAGLSEFTYEYGRQWIVRIISVSNHPVKPKEKPCCAAGEGCAPPEAIEGPLRYRRFLAALKGSNEKEKALAQTYLGAGFDSDMFDQDACTNVLRGVLSGISEHKE
jgi:hypothetical protein